jgi:hypothetical protein
MIVGNQELIELREYSPENIPLEVISEDVGEIIFRQYKNQVDIEFP